MLYKVQNAFNTNLINNDFKINSFIGFIFFCFGSSAPRALRSVEACFMGTEGKMVVGLGSHQDTLHHHQMGWLCWILFGRFWMGLG
jgi:hypothetical protein